MLPVPTTDPDAPVKVRLFKGAVYQDVWAAVLFLVHMTVVLSAALYTLGTGRVWDSTTWFPWAQSDPSLSSHPSFQPPLLSTEGFSPSPSPMPLACVTWEQPQYVAAGVTGGVVLTTGLAVAMGWMLLAAQQPLHFLRALLAGYVCLVLTAFLVTVLATGFSLPTLLILLCIPLYFWWWRLLWQRAEFSAVVLKRACATGMCGGAFGRFATHMHDTCSCQLWLSLTCHSWCSGCPPVH